MSCSCNFLNSDHPCNNPVRFREASTNSFDSAGIDKKLVPSSWSSKFKRERSKYYYYGHHYSLDLLIAAGGSACGGRGIVLRARDRVLKVSLPLGTFGLQAPSLRYLSTRSYSSPNVAEHPWAKVWKDLRLSDTFRIILYSVCKRCESKIETQWSSEK